MPILGIIASSKLTVAAGSYEFIATTTASGSSSTVSFNSIPQTYKHLELRYIGKNTRPRLADGFFNLKMNDTYSTYAQSMFFAGPNTAPGELTFAVNNGTGYSLCAAGANSNAAAMGMGVVTMLDYTNTSKLKTFRVISCSMVGDANIGWLTHTTNTLNSTSAITSLVIDGVDGANLGAGSKFSLYGLKAS